MVFNGIIAVTVANKSAEIWQHLVCTPDERIGSQQLLDLICCFPLQQFGRFALCLWSFFCFPPPSPDSYLTYSYYDTDSSSSFDYDFNDDDDDSDDDHHRDYRYASHSD